MSGLTNVEPAPSRFTLPPGFSTFDTPLLPPDTLNSGLAVGGAADSPLHALRASASRISAAADNRVFTRSSSQAVVHLRIYLVDATRLARLCPAINVYWPVDGRPQ